MMRSAWTDNDTYTVADADGLLCDAVTLSSAHEIALAHSFDEHNIEIRSRSTGYRELWHHGQCVSVTEDAPLPEPPGPRPDRGDDTDNPAMPKLLTSSQAAKRIPNVLTGQLGISPRRVRAMAAAGILPGLKLHPRRWLFDAADVERVAAMIRVPHRPRRSE